MLSLEDSCKDQKDQSWIGFWKGAEFECSVKWASPKQPNAQVTVGYISESILQCGHEP